MLDMSIEELLDTFSLLDGWEDRYQFVIDLGESLPAMPDEYKNDSTFVKGCTSQVWLMPYKQGDVFDFHGDSDAVIVKGLIAVLKIIYGGKTTAELRDMDINSIFAELKLTEHLSPNRRNGFVAMVDKLTAYSQQAA